MSIKRKLTFGNVVAAIAVFLALTGSAVAATELARNSVNSASIKNGTVSGKDVKDESLTGADINEATLNIARGAIGTAGGDLTGNYPNPQIGPAVIGTGELAADAVNGQKIEDGTIGPADLADDSVGSSEISVEAVTSNELAVDSVGSAAVASSAVGQSEIATGSVAALELKAMNTVTSSGVDVSAGTPRSTTVACPANQRLIAGGYAWLEDEANSIITNAPNEGDPNHAWDVRGMVNSGSNRLFAWATCLAS